MAILWAVAGLAVLLAAFVTIELVTRWSIRRRARYYVFPPGLRLRLSPDADVFPHLERATRFDVNADGERGDEVPRIEGVFRVLVAGGSQPEGYLLDQETAWPGALQRLLQAPSCRQRLDATRVHVGSIARSGVGSEGLDLIFERVLPRYPRLQLIVILIGATDVLRWLECGVPQIIPPVRVPDVFRCHPEGPFGWRPAQLAIVEAVRRVRRGWLRPLEVHHRAGKWVGAARAMRGRAKLVKTMLPDATPMLQRFDLHFRRALRRAQAHADRVIVVHQPWLCKNYSPEEAASMWHGGVGQAWRSEITTYYSFDVFSTLMRLVNDRAAATADAMGIEHIDVMPVLEPGLATYYDGLHVTPYGARAVAPAVATAIVCGTRRVPSADALDAMDAIRAQTCVVSRAS